MATALVFLAQRAAGQDGEPRWGTLTFHINQGVAQLPRPQMTALFVLWEWGRRLKATVPVPL